MARKNGTAAAGSLALTVSRESLVEGLSAVSPSIAAKTTLPVLGNFLIEATERGIRISGTDLDISISREIAADVESEGSITLPAKRLLAIAKELPPAPVRIRAIKDSKITVECGRARYTLLGLPRDEFPSMPTIDYNAGSIVARELAEMVGLTSFAVSSEESRPILNGVLWQRTKKVIRLVATDGRRLAFTERAIQPSLGSFDDLIVPPKALEHVARLFGEDEEIQLGVGDNHLGFQSPTTTVMTRIIEGPYPDYTQVIPTDHNREIVVDRIAFASSVKRVTPIASGTEHRLTLTIAKGTIGVSAKTPDVGDAYDELGARITGAAITIGMNASFLRQVLTAVGTDEVLIEAQEAKRAVIFRPVHDKAAAVESLFLIMPIRVIEEG